MNIFLIENPEKIRIKYRLFKIKGLLPQSDDYDKNVQLLADRLSRMTSSPCAQIKENDQLFIAQPTGHLDPPERLPLIGVEAIIEPTDIERELDFSNIAEKDLYISTRFLRFQLYGLLEKVNSLWRPGAGMPFFQKDPDPDFHSDEAVMYRGFDIKIVVLPERKIAVCIDTTWKYASKRYLPPHVEPDQFRRYKGKNCIYEFGNNWFEVWIDSISGLNSSEERMSDGTSLFDYVNSKNIGAKSQALSTLPKDCSVFTYKTKLGLVKRMPTALCRLTFTTDHPAIRSYHSRTIMSPGRRKWMIEYIMSNYLSKWSFQGIPIKLSSYMQRVDSHVLTPPDIEFGGGKILSFSNETGKIPTTLGEYGSSKWRLLHSTDAGFFVKKPLGRQYVILPKSMYETFGEKYLEDIKARFKLLYSPDGAVKYDPMIITYNDAVRQSIPTLGNEIVQSVMQQVKGLFYYQGYGLAIIPRLNGRIESEDELGNLVMRELRKKGIFVSVAHRETPASCYYPTQTESGKMKYQITDDEKAARKFRGYLENIVLNKILLLNNLWPFVLSTPLKTDLVIGIDVKNRTAGFVLILKDGKTLSFTTSDSDQKEMLRKGHVSTLVYNLLKRELEGSKLKIRDITIHRDGKLFAGEIKGIKDALERLSKEKLIEADYNCNFVEIRKTSSIPVRFFDIISEKGTMRTFTVNPKIGTYVMFQDNAFLCTTGRPFRFLGTTQPLQVVKIEGKLDFRSILEDVFALSNLTWTKIDYCSRLPISIKLLDIRLREFAGEYSEFEMKFNEEEEVDE
jgi:hypothetical protein